MLGKKGRLAVVVGPPSYRKRQEVAIFQKLPRFETIVIISPQNGSWVTGDMDYAYSELARIVPDFLAGFAVRKPYSPVSFVKLLNLEKCLKDVDVINSIELYSFISRQCAEIIRKKRKLTVSIFETLPSIPLHQLLPFSRNVKKVLKQANAFIVYTNRSAEYLHCLMVPKDKIKVVYPGVDLERFYPSKNQDHDNIRILFVGGFAGEKGLTILLEAFSKLYTDKPLTELWICAKPRNEKEEALIKSYTRKYPIKMFGYVDYDKIPEIYRQCDIFCLPSFDKKKWGIKVWEEQFGFALVEAMASGLPIVATDCGSVPEIVGEENLVVAQKSVKSLYLALRLLISDEDYLLHLVEMNRKRAAKLFNIEKQREAMDKVLCELL